MRHPTLSRRSFLRHATLAVSVPALLPGSVWSADIPPSERLRLGFIGVGIQGRSLLSNCLRRPGVVVTAVCDVDTRRRQHAHGLVVEHETSTGAANPGSGCSQHSDFRGVLARSDVDAVVIATPDHWHAMIGILAAKAGKDIYCEKPLTQTIHEARELVRAVRTHQRVFQVGSMQRSSREFRRACQLVRNGALGTLREIRVGVGGPAQWCDLPAEPVEPGLDWDLWLGPAPWRDYNSVLSPRGIHTHYPNWRAYREYGGGGVTDWGAHHFDIAQWALGMDASGPVEVLPPETSGAKSGVRFRYADGTIMLHTQGNGVTFEGTQGRIVVNRGKFESTPESLVEVPLDQHPVRLYDSNDHIGDWLDCIRTRKPPICDVEVGARTVTVCHLANLAYWNHQRLEWDPATETFVGGHGDPSWLDRPYREPWTLKRTVQA